MNILKWPDHFPQMFPKPEKPNKSTAGTNDPSLAIMTAKKPGSKDIQTPADSDKLTLADHEALDRLIATMHVFCKADLAESVIKPTLNNPGFDLVFFEKKTGGVDYTYCNYLAFVY